MRVTNGPVTRARRNRVKKAVSGAWGTKHTSYKIARQTMIRAEMYAYRDRKHKKTEFRKLWINRVNSALRAMGYNYSTFINGMKKHNILVNRKMISEIIISNPEAFKALVEKAMAK
ncbi:MAG: 50S ribosomal protein L20 [Mycoplasmoidaceae bacterium]|nr:MAG: 50S ribosomal protein L20 [Mycoplasmoidaceae bacterium]GMO23158.1 MAG: 50S ribosomal protein L20 [Mycoplasmoidaceae bacterium]